ncbi:ubiquitin carboxyl-terminal hydrolase 37-like isoform X3 [Synchiropus splendidus]|uniref:ubiquitin carboxyl-terminal hydrolase 37-like isoform X3 n=1 Tax=Synchiropus splendidus TaxID=270530 RepID=UPI00237EB7A4|nr:ubiquitin carboxyl-terminal hydrolase 37-like isoform X3 [Synchiropus splendidus]
MFCAPFCSESQVIDSIEFWGRQIRQQSRGQNLPVKKKTVCDWLCAKGSDSISPIAKEPKPLVALDFQDRKDPREETDAVASTSTSETFQSLGFPNPGNYCYINATLQSLLTLVDFVRDIRGQKSDSTVIRTFMNIQACHNADNQLKSRLLVAFKHAVAEEAPEFKNNTQKDAHEFLVAVMEHMMHLQAFQDSLLFQMVSNRMCTSCATGSYKEEAFTHISLNLSSGGKTVRQLLRDFMMTQLDYCCQCGSQEANQQYSFVTLPKVLVLHLKRFKYTGDQSLSKITEPISLQKDLLVPSDKGGGKYYLVSIISHIGPGASRGHYISDGVNPYAPPTDPSDSWLTYNDLVVSRTSCKSVCEQRQETAYILFYNRLVREGCRLLLHQPPLTGFYSTGPCQVAGPRCDINVSIGTESLRLERCQVWSLMSSSFLLEGPV